MVVLNYSSIILEDKTINHNNLDLLRDRIVENAVFDKVGRLFHQLKKSSNGTFKNRDFDTVSKFLKVLDKYENIKNLIAYK
jgi:hypothetical protein